MRLIDHILAVVVVGAVTFTMDWPRSAAFAADPAFQILAGERQLFLDDVGIETVQNLHRTMHPPAKKGAVIRPTPKEGSVLTLCAPIWIPEKKIYRIWLLSSVGYADSKDGITWTRPAYPPPNLPANAVHYLQGAVYDPYDPDPSRRFKGMTYGRGGTTNRLGLQPVVSDGLIWRKLGVPPIPAGDTNMLYFDRQERLFIATVRCGGPNGRSVALSTSKDFEHWTKPELIFHADMHDQELGRRNIKARLADPTLQQPGYNKPSSYQAEMYDMAVFRYEGLYIGMPLVYHATGPLPYEGNTEGFNHIQLVCSRDLRNWKRLGNRKPFIGPSRLDSGAYDLTQLGPCAPVLRLGEDTYSGNDELWFYYNGTKYRGIRRQEFPDIDPDGAAICLAVLRRDGFISLDATDTEGIVQIKPFTVPSGKLHVNVDAPKGELRVELLNGDGNVVAKSKPLTGDLLRELVTWAEGNIADLKDQTASLRFTLRNGQFYSYWLK